MQSNDSLVAELKRAWDSAFVSTKLRRRLIKKLRRRLRRERRASKPSLMDKFRKAE